jgi:hypothetical protein
MKEHGTSRLFSAFNFYPPWTVDFEKCMAIVHPVTPFPQLVQARPLVSLNAPTPFVNQEAHRSFPKKLEIKPVVCHGTKDFTD